MSGGYPVAVPPSGDRLSQQLGYGAGWLVDMLPLGMQSDDFLVRFLSIFEEVATTLRASADSVGRIADVNITSAEMVRYLGEWVGAPAVDARLPERVQRNIVLAAGATISSRGTAGALRRMLAAVTDDTVEVFDRGGVYREGGAPSGPADVYVRVASTGHLSTDRCVDLVLGSLPADAPVTIEVAGEVVYPTLMAVSA